MSDVLIKACSFVIVIAIGYLVKRSGFLSVVDSRVLSKIMINITLPGAVISGFAKFQADHTLLLAVLLGLGCNLVLMFGGWLVSRKRSRDEQALFVITTPGYNIGCFTLPYVQSFLGPVGIVATCLFDVGNSIICTGGSFATACSVVGKSSGLLSIVKRVFSSVPFDVYVIFLAIASFGIPIPAIIATPASMVGNANPFIAMFLIGMLLELNINRRDLLNALKILLLRYAAGAFFAWLFYFHTSFAHEVRLVLAVAVFSPVSALSPVFTARLSNKASVASFAGSMSIILSIIIMTAMMSFSPA